MNVAEEIVESLLEGEMPDWLKKKISGKSDDDEGGESEGKDDEGGEKAEKKSSGGSKPSANVAAACGPAPGKVKNSI